MENVQASQSTYKLVYASETVYIWKMFAQMSCNSMVNIECLKSDSSCVVRIPSAGVGGVVFGFLVFFRLL